MAKRVFQIAKELSVKSKAIVEKCEAEGVPNITNHMSSVSAGLEQTIREWFSGGEEEGGDHTAVETSDRVDLTKVRVAPRKKAARKKAAARPSAGPAVESGDGGSTTAVAEPEAPGPDSSAASAAGAEGDDRPGAAVDAGSSAVETPDEHAETPTSTGEREEQTGASVPAGPAAATGVGAPPAEAGEIGPDASPTEAAAAAASDAAPADAGAPAPAEPTRNVPTRPEVTKPAGPKLEVQKPAKLSGPKVVRIEQPDVVEQRAPRSSPRSFEELPTSPAARGGGGATGRGGRGGEGGGGAGGGGDDRGRSRNKRRGDRSDAPRRGGKSFREQDLLERQQRLSRSGGLLRQRRRDQKIKGGSAPKPPTPAQAGGPVKVSPPLTIKDLSAATGVKAAEIVKKLFMQGVMTNVNAGIDIEKAQEIMIEFDIELQVEEKSKGVAAVEQEYESRTLVDEQRRRPVVTILGHVDHGKTSLLDRIRKTEVAAGEAGGITQATSAFVVDVGENAEGAKKQLCFFDTPGHEAFTEMRSRGATITDVVVLVIAADDGVMPQTVESINHAKAAGVPIVVALNKIDLPGVDANENIQRIYGQLAEHELNPTEWGGDTEVLKVSAETGRGVDELLEMLDYQAELLELKADFGGSASGTVIEAQLLEGRGAVANILVQQGELSVGDNIVAGRAFGRVRDMTNDRGERIKTAGPSTPVQISGIDILPDAGDKFFIVKNLRAAQDAAEERRNAEREAQLAQPKLTLDSMFARMDAAETKELLIVLKADVQGSLDAIRKSIEDIATEEVRIRVLHAAVGGVAESDVTLAGASNAVIIGFNVIPSARARTTAEQKGVEIRAYQVIYDIVDDVKQAAEGLLAPELRQEVLGHAEVRQVFRISKVGSIAGCYVTDGTIERNAFIRVTRDDIVIENDRVLEQLKRFKDDVKDVRSGQECGMKIEGYDDIKEGDILECYRRVEVRRSL